MTPWAAQGHGSARTRGLNASRPAPMTAGSSPGSFLSSRPMRALGPGPGQGWYWGAQGHRDTKKVGTPRWGDDPWVAPGFGELSARPPNHAGDALAQKPPVLGHGVSVHLWGQPPPLSPPGQPPNVAAEGWSSAFPFSFPPAASATENKPKPTQNEIVGRVPPCSCRLRLSLAFFKCQGKRLRGRPARGARPRRGAGDRRGTGRGGRGGRDTLHPCSCRCRP